MEDELSTDIAAAQSVALTEEEEAELATAATAGIDTNDLELPMLKVLQGLSKEVSDEDTDDKAGDFLNSLTGENYGTEINLIIAGYFKGRFYSDPEDNVFVAQGDVAPGNWPEEYAGQNFADIPEAEEQTKARANAPGGKWVKPKIETTHNYIALNPDELDIPVRLSLKSTGTKAHRRIATLLSFAPGGRPWSNVFELRTKRQSKGDKVYYEVVVDRGASTTTEQQQAATTLAQQFQRASQVRLTGEVDERAEAREVVADADSGGLDVS